MNKKGKKNLALMIGFVSFGLVAGITCTYFLAPRTIEKTVYVEKTDGIILSNDKVAIKYYDNSNGGYDVLVETKNGTNISPEWTNQAGENYAFTYLVGKSKEQAKDFWNMNLKEHGINWTWEQNYPIDGDN